MCFFPHNTLFCCCMEGKSLNSLVHCISQRHKWEQLSFCLERLHSSLLFEDVAAGVIICDLFFCTLCVLQIKICTKWCQVQYVDPIFYIVSHWDHLLWIKTGLKMTNQGFLVILKEFQMKHKDFFHYFLHISIWLKKGGDWRGRGEELTKDRNSH